LYSSPELSSEGPGGVPILGSSSPAFSFGDRGLRLLHGVETILWFVATFARTNTKALQENPIRNQQILDRIPLDAGVNRGDIAGAMVFLCAKASNSTNGHVLHVDGGWIGR
jgi:NAD(P)-dependent dehydrogenase (short-subunit alcohol dehydrogenase family)